MNLRHDSDSSHRNARIRRVTLGSGIIAVGGLAYEVPAVGTPVLIALTAMLAWAETRDRAH